MDMHESPGGTGLLTEPEPPDPEPRSARRARRRGKGLVAALVAAGLVLLGANAAIAYFGHRISVDEKIESFEPAR
jgi:hypothetical protein